jgi:hypothetical protein
MAAGKKPKDRRRWSLPPESDPRQKEFVPPFTRRESDAVKLQVQGWLKLAERALTDKDDEDQSRVA